MSDMDMDSIADVGSVTNNAEVLKGVKRMAIADDDNDSLFVSGEGGSGEPHQNHKRIKTSDVSAAVFHKGDRPCLAIYHPSFAAAEREVQHVCDTFTEVYKQLKANGYANEAIENVCSNLDRYRKPSSLYPAVRPVACLGPAGVGKSSSINSILGQKMAAPESDGAERGTFVVHEYVSAHHQQVQQYRVEVPYRSPRQVGNLVAKHCSNIMKHKAAQESEMDHEEDDDDDDDLQQKYETAIEFFCDLLCDQDDFDTKEKVEDYFEDRKTDDFIKVSADLLNMVNTFVDCRADKNRSEIFDARDETELCDVFKKVSRPSTNRGKKGREPSPWPLIPKIQVQQDLDILNAEVKLGDTAGINDSNLSVVQNTRDYLSEAGTILVFARMMRIAKNTELDNHLRECILLGKMHNICLVVTNIDPKNVSSSSAIDDIDEHEQDRLSRAKADIKHLEQEIKDTKADKAAETDDTKFREHDKRLSDLVSRCTQAKASLQQLTVLTQCRTVAAKLEDKLQKLGKSKKAPSLKTIFISNTEFQKHSEEYDEQNAPTLDLEATGIPELRRFLYSIPARGRLRVLQTICNLRLSHIFSGIQGILTKSTLERKAEVKSILEQELKQHDGLVIEFRKKIMRSFEKNIIQFIEDNDDQWSDQGCQLLESWNKQMKSGTFAAFCRKSGVWRLPSNKKKFIYWNSEIRAIFENELNKAFEELVDKLDRVEGVWDTELKSIFDRLQEAVQGAEAAQGIPMNSFFAYIREVKAGMDVDFVSKFDFVKSKIGQIRVECVVEGKTTCVASIMDETYEKCAKFAQQNFNDENAGRRRVKKKLGRHELRVECLRDRITGESDGNSIFKAVGHQAKKDFERYMEEWETDCGQTMREGTKKILQDFDGRFQESEVKGEEDAEAVATLQEAATNALEVIHGPMKEHLQECEAYEKNSSKA